jgi:hypothetical protein
MYSRSKRKRVLKTAPAIVLVANALGAHDLAAMRPAPDDTLIVADGATMKQNRFDAGNVAAVNPLHWHRGSGRGHRNKAKHGGADSGDQ